MALDIGMINPFRNIDCSECIDDRYDLAINGLKLNIGETVFIKMRGTKRPGWKWVVRNLNWHQRKIFSVSERDKDS